MGIPNRGFQGYNQGNSFGFHQGGAGFNHGQTWAEAVDLSFDVFLLCFVVSLMFCFLLSHVVCLGIKKK